jgi:hypothetical protein
MDYPLPQTKPVTYALASVTEDDLRSATESRITGAANTCLHLRPWFDRLTMTWLIGYAVGKFVASSFCK